MKKRKFFLVFATALIAALVVGTAFASGVEPKRDFTEDLSRAQVDTGYRIVMLNNPPVASYTGDIPGLARTKPDLGQKLDPNSQAVKDYAAYVNANHLDYRNYLASKAPRAEVVREYHLVANAIAIKLNGTQPETLANGPGVRAVVNSSLYKPTMNVSVELIGASELWNATVGQENAGAGIKVGVIDSGIDDTHRFFECKDEIAHKVYASGVAFDPSNVLVVDHGTHVAGTIAGCVIELTEGPIQDTISGVAPGAELSDYNVFPGFGAGYIAFGGSAFSHDIIAALEDTVRDGMDVVNMSLGGGVSGPHDILAEAVDATVDAGLVVAVAAGNSGPGNTTVESPGNAAGALTAGASTNPHFIGIPLTVTDPNLGTFGAALGDFDNFVPPIVSVQYGATTPTDGCTTISEDLSGMIALIDRGTCTFTTKVRNAENAGAIGVLVANNIAGDPVAMGHDGTDPFPTIPAAMVSKDNGAAMKPSGTVTINGTTITEFVTDNADIIYVNSGRGPTPYNYLIKPDVIAPGVNVYSSVFEDEFAMFQGTSMASPHLAGSAALLLDLHPSWSPFDVKSAIVNTAARVVTDHDNGTEDPGVLARGGGRVDLVAANATPLTIDPVSASFGFWEGNKPVVGSLDLTLFDQSDGATCAVTVTGSEIVSASTAEIMVPDDGSGTLTLMLDAGRANTTPSGDYSGDVVLNCDGIELKVPWWVRIDREGKP